MQQEKFERSEQSLSLLEPAAHFFNKPGFGLTPKRRRRSLNLKMSLKLDLPNTEAKRILASVLIASIVSGCAPFPSKSATGEREYRYRAPAHVEENDRAECVARADSAATAAALSLTYQIEEGVGTVFGLFGALVGATAAMARTRAVAEDTYEQEMKACLEGKGYDLPK